MLLIDELAPNGIQGFFFLIQRPLKQKSGHSMLAPLRFSSKIRFIPYQEFRALPLAEMDANGENAFGLWRPQDRVSVKPRGFTESAGPCTISGINNASGSLAGDGRLTLFHLLPGTENQWKNPDAIRKAFKEDVRRLKEAGKPVRGFITGGTGTGLTCDTIFQILQDLFEEEKLPYSVLWGVKKNPDFTSSNLYYSAAEDTWTVCLSDPRETVPESLEEIQETYQFNHIAEGDTLEIGGKICTALDVPSRLPTERADLTPLERRKPSDPLVPFNKLPIKNPGSLKLPHRKPAVIDDRIRQC